MDVVLTPSDVALLLSVSTFEEQETAMLQKAQRLARLGHSKTSHPGLEMLTAEPLPSERLLPYCEKSGNTASSSRGLHYR